MTHRCRRAPAARVLPGALPLLLLALAARPAQAQVPPGPARGNPQQGSSAQASPEAAGYRFQNAPLGMLLSQVGARTGARFQVDRGASTLRVTLDADPIPPDRLALLLAAIYDLDLSVIGDLTVISARAGSDGSAAGSVDSDLLEGVWRLEAGDYRYRNFRNDLERVAAVLEADGKDAAAAWEIERKLSAEWREVLAFARAQKGVPGEPDGLRGGRSYIGVSLGTRDQVTDPTLREKLRAWDGRGAVVTMVMEASPSEAAGLRVGDAVLRANRVWIDSPSTMIRLVSRLSAGDDLELWTIRDGGILIQHVTVGERDPNDPATPGRIPVPQVPRR